MTLFKGDGVKTESKVGFELSISRTVKWEVISFLAMASVLGLGVVFVLQKMGIL